MVIVSDSGNTDAAVANMLITTVMRASLVGVFIPLKAYRYFSGQGGGWKQPDAGGVVWYYGYGLKDTKVCPPWRPIAGRGLLQVFVGIGGH